MQEKESPEIIGMGLGWIMLKAQLN